MLQIRRHGILLEKTRNGFENEAVCNPAVIREGEFIYVFYRAVRKGNYSSIGYCKLNSGLNVIERKNKPILFPEKKYASQGLEDPRIVKIEDLYYLTYSVYDGINVRGAYATSKDLKNFKKHKVITPNISFAEYKNLIECCSNLSEKYLAHYHFFEGHGLHKELSRKLYIWDKNIMFFPKKINGNFALLHRIHPGIQIVYFKDFRELTTSFWKNYLLRLEDHIIMDPEMPHESNHIGGGCPPIETKDGWLLIYHSVENTAKGYVYHASAALLDLRNPKIELARLPYPLISPTHVWEKKGIVNNVIFPTGTSIIEDRLLIFYGAADSKIGTASVNLNDLLTELKMNM